MNCGKTPIISKVTRKLKHKRAKMPALILEKMGKPSDPDLGDDFVVHAVCVNCWLGMNSKIDTWRSGSGFFMPEFDYFGQYYMCTIVHCTICTYL